MRDAVRVNGNAPGMRKSELPNIYTQLLKPLLSANDKSKDEVCIILNKRLKRYDFPGYLPYENFVRGRISPVLISGLIVASIEQERIVSEIAQKHEHEVYIAKEIVADLLE
jgi:hypothetical protein